MIVTLLGTNGWFDTETGQTMCSLIRTPDYSIILDAGFGIRRAKALIDFSKPTFLLLSHLHLDHTAGMHLMDYFNFQIPLKIILPPGQQRTLLELCRLPFTTDLVNALPDNSEIFAANDLAEANLPFELTSLPLCHPVPDNGYRIGIGGKVVTYLCDTGYCGNAVTLAKDADLVIAECGTLPGTAKAAGPHMDPATCAKLANEAHVKQMVLTHFGAAAYTSIPQRMLAVDEARSIYPNLITGVDNIEFVL